MPKVDAAYLEARRRQILDAAVACFSRRGIHETTMADIAREAGISTGLAYRYFAGKKEIVAAALEEDGAGEGSPGGGDLDLRQLLHVILGRSSVFKPSAGDPATTAGLRLRVQSWARAIEDPATAQAVLGQWRWNLEVIEGFVRQAQQEGRIDARLDAHAFGLVMVATYDGLCLHAAVDTATDLEPCLDVLIEMVFGGREGE